MNKIRIRFTRGQELKFISHLDMLKVFERALRRADVPIAYSEGFNPHIKMEFALPLAVGVTSDSEYADLEFEQEYSIAELKEKLNNTLPEGINIVNASVIESNKSLMSVILAAEYFIDIATENKLNDEELDDVVGRIMANAEIVTNKKTKKGIKQVNIRPMIYKLWHCPELYLNDDVLTQYKYVYRVGALISSGSEQNLSPMLLADVVIQYLEGKSVIQSIHRTGLYTDKEGKITPING